MFWSEEFLIPKEPISEDCLTLNVWTPAKNKNDKKPVFVYIYGGGFRSGGSACPIYDGVNIAKKDIVYVSFNYRVGILGFQAHPELSAESPSGTSGNYGILDMIAALKWVQENIEQFGGDPNNVTIAGQSAGAFGVNYLTTSPLANGLFHKAIAQSGGSFIEGSLRTQRDKEIAEATGLALAKEMGVSSLEELRKIPASQFITAREGIQSPHIDGHVLKYSIMETYQKGLQNDVPMIIGWNKEDIVMGPPVPKVEFLLNAKERFGNYFDQFMSVYPIVNDEDAKTVQIEMSRDQTFGIQGYTWANMQLKTGQSVVYVYNFNRALPASSPETQFGAFHSGEIVYAYDNLHTLQRPWEPIDQSLADAMSGHWANFAKTGDPNGETLVSWPAYGDDQITMLYDKNSVAVPLPTVDKLDFWSSFLTDN